jgi:hypothetical protein
MPARTVRLRGVRDSGGSRSLTATLTGAGDLVLDAQDLGPGVEAFWGEGNTEYEWNLTVRAANVPAAAAALGGAPGDDVLGLLEDWYRQRRDHELKPALESAGVPIEFWSRVGD